MFPKNDTIAGYDDELAQAIAAEARRQVLSRGEKHVAARQQEVERRTPVRSVMRPVAERKHVLRCWQAGNDHMEE